MGSPPGWESEAKGESGEGRHYPHQDAKQQDVRGTQGAKQGTRAHGTRETQETQETSFCTVGERLSPLRTAEDVARFARTVEATRTAKSHLLNDR